MSKASVFEAVNATAGMASTVFPASMTLPAIRNHLIKIGDLVPQWWSPSRDRALRDTWMDNGAFLSGIMFNAANKLANIPFRIVPRDPTIASHVDQAAQLEEQYGIASEFAAGIHATMLKFAQDWLGTDNGGFIEILGDGKRDTPLQGAPWAIRHLDSLDCIRTGDPIWPVKVMEPQRGPELIHWTRIFFSSQLPSPIKEAYGVGYCSVSRSIMIAHDLSSMLKYKAEKMGSRPKSKMLVGKNIDGEEIMQAFAVADAIMNELGLENFAKLVAIGGPDIEVAAVDLNTFDPFDEKTQTTLGLYALAFAWGLEPSEVMPVSSSQGNEEVAMQRSRGKLPQVYVSTVEQQLGFRLLPAHLKLMLDFPDDARDKEVALIEDIHARNSQRMVASGATTPNIERRRMLERNAISRHMFMEMQLESFMLEDGTPVGSLFFDERYANLLLVPREFLVVRDIWREEAVASFQANALAVMSAMNTSSTAQKRRAREALAALRWAESLYKEQPPEQREPVAPIGATERTPLEDGGATDKSATFFQRLSLTTLSEEP